MKIKDLKNDVGEIDLSETGKKTSKLIKSVFKSVFISLVLFVMFAALINVTLLLYEENRLARVDIDAGILRVGDDQCDFRKPLYVTLTNNSEKTITQTRYDIEVRRIGYSSDIAGYDLKRLDTDKILLPGESANFCLTLDLKYPHDETYAFNLFDADAASLEYAQNYRGRNIKATEDLILTGVVTSVEYK